MGVLQRISIAYIAAAVITANLTIKKQYLAAIFILLFYWATMMLIPVSGYGPGNLTPDGNLASYIDRAVLTRTHMYNNGHFDPEGLFSTLPAIVTVLFGYFTGKWIQFQPVKSTTSIKLLLSGIGFLTAGHLWGSVFPINKALWTSSYVFYTTGWALMLMAVCYETIEVNGWRTMLSPFEIMGLNSIFIYIGSGLIVRISQNFHMHSAPDTISYYSWIYKYLFVSWAGWMNGSLAFSLTFLTLWWIVLYFMHRKRLFITV